MDVLLAMKRKKNKNRFDVKIVQVVEAGSSFEIVPKFPDMA